MKRRKIILLSVLLSVQANAAPLPEPLTLQDAMDSVDENHPTLLAAQSRILGAEASRLDTEADHGLYASVDGRLRYVDPPSTATLQQHDDHSLNLNVRKRLYDFGYKDARLAAAHSEHRGYESLLVDASRQQKLNVINAYFAVIEADLRAAWHSEAMQVLFLKQEDEVERVDVEERSELDAARTDAVYQAALARSYASEALQRSSRSLLAQALNRPDELPSTVVRPDLPLLKQTVPEDVAPLIEEAVNNNAALQGYLGRLHAASKSLEAARASGGPTLDAEGRVSTFSRRLGSNDRVRVGLVLEIPLTTGGRTQALVQRSRANLLALQAERARFELDLRQRVLETWQALQLGRYERTMAEAELELRSQELERSRTLFDLEVASNLGDAMSGYTRAEFEQAVIDHKLALSWMQLDALLGRDVSLTGSAPTSGVIP